MHINRRGCGLIVACHVALAALQLAGCTWVPGHQPATIEPGLSEDHDAGSASAPVGDYVRLREQLVDVVAENGVGDPKVLQALREVPRHLFVPDEFARLAYEDRPLPIGYGQTISQPFIVAQMTEALELQPGDKVLEVGTGSGYQAAVLAEIVDEVYTIEIIGALALRSADLLEGLGYDGIAVRHGDGYFGWDDESPFDAIIVTAAPDHVPPPLRAQLADGGRLVIPVGPVGGYQELWLVERDGDRFATSSLGGVIFVPLTRDKRDE